MTHGNSRMGKSWKIVGILSVIIVGSEMVLYLMKHSTLKAAIVIDKGRRIQSKDSDVTTDFQKVNYDIIDLHQDHDDVTSTASSAQENDKSLRRKLAGGNESSQLAEVQHIVFLKVHKAASTTVQGILMRFGYMNKLEFVLPKTGNYFSQTTHEYRPIVAPFVGDHYDIFCVHCQYNHTIVSSLMPGDSMHIAIVRDPWQLFVSAFHYYKTVYMFKYLLNVSLSKLVMYPDKYEPSELSYTRNSMARDFGFSKEHYSHHVIGSTSSSAHAYLNKIDKMFDLVLVAEWLDESLILMKRLLNWKLKNILYISKNVKQPEANMTSKDDILEEFKERNKLDYLIYDHFLERFKIVLNKGGESLRQETDNFRRIVADVQVWCTGSKQETYRVPETHWNEAFDVTASYCSLMQIEELPFINLLRSRKSKRKQRSDIN